MLRDRALDLGRRRVLGEASPAALHADRDIPHLLLGELERVRERAGHVGEHALARRRRDDRGDLLEGEGACTPRSSARRRNRRRMPFAVDVERHDHRAEHVATRAPAAARASAPARSGSENDRFLGTISPSTTCRNETIDQRDDERDRADHLLRAAGEPERDSSRWWIAGSRHVQDEQRADRDAELAGREHQRRVLHRPERRLGGARSRLGARLDLRAARRDDRELGARRRTR